MFEIILHWINKIEYLEYMFFLCYSCNIEDYKFNFNEEYTNDYSEFMKYTKFLGVFSIMFSVNDLYVNHILLKKSVRKYFDIEISHKSHHASDESKRKDRKKNKCKIIDNYYKEKLNIEELRVIKYIGITKTEFIHPVLLFYTIEKMAPFKFRELIDSYIKNKVSLDECDELMNFKIDFNNNITRRCKNPRFAYAIHGDDEIKFDTETSYIHARTTADIINPKKSKHIDDFFKLNETQEFLLELEQSLNKKNNIDSQSLNEKSFDNKYWKSDNNIKSFYILKYIELEYRGYYFHPDLFLFFLMWLSKSRTLKYIKILNIIMHKNAIENKSIEKYINNIIKELENKIKNMQNNIEEYKQLLVVKDEIIVKKNNVIEKQEELIVEKDITIDNLKTKLIEITPPNGSVSITILDENEGRAKILHTNYPQIKRENTMYIITDINHEKIYKKINAFISDFPTEYIRNEKNNKYYITDKQKALQYIYDIIDDKIPITYNNSNLESNIEKYNDNKPKQYEYLSALKFNAIPWNNLPYSFLTKYGLNKKDIGIDLIEPINKIAYQCKYYVSKYTKINITKNLDTFIRTVNIFKTYDTEWKSFLIVAYKDKCSNDVLNTFDIIEYNPYDENINNM